MTMPTNRSVLRLLLQTCAVCALIASHADAAHNDAARAPNVVIIISDDAGYADLGFTGGRLVATPNLDAIAREGATLEQFYTTASVCSPSRAGFLTGRYQQRFGHHSNLTGPASKQGLGLPTSEATIADHLGARGYTTALVGKWHLGAADPLVPTRRGFDHFRGLIAGSRSYFAYDEPKPEQTMRLTNADDDTHRVEMLDEAALEGFHVTDWIGASAAALIDAHAGDNPLLLIVSFTAPHTPMEAVDEDLAEVQGVRPPRRRTYAAMVRALDRAVGLVTDAIERSGDEENTIVMFFNDNGGATNNGSDNGRYRGMKGSKWEGGIRVPAAIRWPGVIEPGTVFTPMVSSMDLAATAIHAGGGALDRRAPLDGRNLAGTLRMPGPWADDAVHDALFWERGPASAVRRGPWKLISTTETDPMLFHIPGDPSETTDLAADHPEIVEELLARLAAWKAETVAPLWTEGERWERNQIRKHSTSVLGRDAERKYP